MGFKPKGWVDPTPCECQGDTDIEKQIDFIDNLLAQQKKSLREKLNKVLIQDPYSNSVVANKKDFLELLDSIEAKKDDKPTDQAQASAQGGKYRRDGGKDE